MEPKPHMRKVEVSLSDAEDLTLNSLKRMHPDWVRKNGDWPSVSCPSIKWPTPTTPRR